jgi:hypothetical protein
MGAASFLVDGVEHLHGRGAAGRDDRAEHADEHREDEEHDQLDHRQREGETEVAEGGRGERCEEDADRGTDARPRPATGIRRTPQRP